MDEEVTNLLTAWGLGSYIEVFKENEITSLSLPLLGESEIKDLIPKVGPRSIFQRNLEIYKKTMHPDSHNSNACEDLDISISDLLHHYPHENEVETSTPNTKSPLTIVNASKPSTSSQSPNPPLTITIPTESQIDVYDLKLLLSNSLEGKGLLNLDKTNPLENAARQRLVRIIGTAILRDTPDKLIRSTVYANWAREIVRVFPCEKPSVYFHSKIVESTRGLITRLAGKLPDQIHNLKRKYRDSGVIEKRRRISRSSSDGSLPPSPSLRLPEEFNVEQEEEFSDSIIWLRNSSEPWTTVLQKWRETTRTRLNLSKELPISQYFKEYPALRKSTGYILLEKDFEELYAGKYTDIFESFPSLKENIFKLAKKRKGHNKDTTLNELLSLQDSSEEISNIACMLLIPTLLAVTSVRLKNSQKKVWRPSKAEVREGFITHVKNDSDVSVAFRDNRQYLVGAPQVHPSVPGLSLPGPDAQASYD